MSVVNVDSFIVKESRSGHSIPVVNDVHLHSIYDPLKESKNFAENHTDTIRNKNQILVLGLGFGYHLDEIYYKMRDKHKTNFKICVLEPCQKTFEDYTARGLNSYPNDPKVSFYIGQEVSDLYNNRAFVDFLIQRPGVIAQTASFNLFKDYFTRFLSFKVPKTVSYLVKSVKEESLQEYLTTFGEASSFNEVIKQIQGKRDINNQDHILLALHEMTANRNQPEVTNE